MTMPPPDGEMRFLFGGETWTFRLDWSAIAFFERESGASLAEFWEDFASGRPKLSHIAWLIQAGLQRHHAGVDFETCGLMSCDRKVIAALELGTAGAMPDADEDDAPGNGASAAAH